MSTKWRDRRLPNSLWLSVLLVPVVVLLIPSFSLATKKPQPAVGSENQNVDWDKALIKGEPQPTLKIPVAHQHAATGCYGYLYVTRDEIWYDVTYPPNDRSHAFRFPRATLTAAQQWRFMGSVMPEVEFKFSNGRTYHFFRVRELLSDPTNQQPRKFGWDDVLSWEPLAQAAMNFDDTVRMAEERQRALAPKPIPTISLTVTPETVEKGHPVTVTWNSENATSLDIEPGIGPVQGSGSRSLTPTESTTYVLTAQGPGGGNNTSGHVTVNTPVTPPAIVLVEPSVAEGQTLEVGSSRLTIHGIVMDSSGLAVVTVNGAPAALRPKSPQAAEFTADPIVLQPGDNKFEVAATNAAHAEAKISFTARFKTPAPPAPPAAPPANPRALDKADILQLLSGEVPSARVAGLVKERGIKFTLTAYDEADIRAAGGGDDVIEALRQSVDSARQ
jgi:hypothetical protein